MPDYPIIDAHIHTFPRPEIGWQAQSGAGRSGHAGTVEEIRLTGEPGHNDSQYQ